MDDKQIRAAALEYSVRAHSGSRTTDAQVLNVAQLFEGYIRYGRRPTGDSAKVDEPEYVTVEARREACVAVSRGIVHGPHCWFANERAQDQQLYCSGREA